MNVAQRGYWSGILANGPMTYLLFALQENLLKQPEKALPPAELTAQVTQPLGTASLDSSEFSNLMMASHFGFSIGAGTLYATLKSFFKPNRTAFGAVASGTGFGILVWIASYLGWMELFGLKSRATNLSPRQNSMMIVAHLFWGAGLGYGENELRKFSSQILDGRPG